MPRLARKVRDEIVKLKGTESQRNVADMFGVNVSTVSRLWKGASEGVAESKAEPAQSKAAEPAKSVDRFDVDVADLKGRETIRIDVKDDKFLTEMNATLDGFHDKLKANDMEAGAKGSSDPLLGDVPMGDGPVKMPDFRDVPDDIFNTGTLKSIGVPEEFQPKGPTPLAKMKEMEAGSIMDAPPDLSKLPPAPEPEPLDPYALEATKALAMQETAAPKKRGRKRKTPVVEELPPAIAPELPTVEVVQPKQAWSKDMMIARMVRYLKRYQDELALYVGRTDAERQAYLAELTKMSTEQVEERYKQLRSVVNFDSQTQFVMVGAYAMTEATEGATVMAGLHTQGLTERVFSNKRTRMEVEECCQDFVMEHPQYFTGTRSSFVRFGMVLLETCKDMQLSAMANEAMSKVEVESEGVLESKGGDFAVEPERAW